MDESQLATWMDGYVRAWRSNDPADVAALFSDDAVYRTTPYREPWRGRDAIVAGWLGRQDVEGNWEFQWEPLVVGGDRAVVQGRTTYREPPEDYSNLWVMRFDAHGRCRDYTEWWMLHE